MKRNYVILTTFILSVVFLSSYFDLSVKGQRTAVFDTGIISLGPNQILRVSIVGDWNGDGRDDIGVRQIRYSQGTCNSDGVCRMFTADQTNMPPLMIASGEAVTMDIAPLPNSSGIRAIVRTSGNRRTKINVMIIDTMTGQVTSAQTGDGLILGNLLN